LHCDSLYKEGEDSGFVILFTGNGKQYEEKRKNMDEIVA